MEQGRKVTTKNFDVGKAKVLIAESVPASVVNALCNEVTSGAWDEDSFSVAKKRHGSSWRDPLEEDVSRDIKRRIDVLGKSGRAFEEAMPYSQYNERDVVDAEYIVRGIDPATVGQNNRGSFVARRKIPVERRHWLACKVGHYMTPNGVAYVHADGSIAIFRHGEASACRCGAVHTC